MMNYLERQSLIDGLKKVLSEYVIGEIEIIELMTCEPGVWSKYCVRIKNKNMNYEWKCIIDEDINTWNTKLFENVLEKYKTSIYKEFFFY